MAITKVTVAVRVCMCVCVNNKKHIVRSTASIKKTTKTTTAPARPTTEIHEKKTSKGLALLIGASF